VDCFSSQAFSQVLAACLPISNGKIGGDGDMMRIRRKITPRIDKPEEARLHRHDDLH
jgi:hypothetical protein